MEVVNECGHVPTTIRHYYCANSDSSPSWHDVSVDSEFIQYIFSKLLSPDLPYYLFFSYKGDSSIFMNNNDGTVELASELDYRAQADAVRIFGYDEDHDSIMKSGRVLEQYNEILNSIETKKR